LLVLLKAYPDFTSAAQALCQWARAIAITAVPRACLQTELRRLFTEKQAVNESPVGFFPAVCETQRRIECDLRHNNATSTML
jgi:hypothetical protein